ncbi:hypothetical protein HDU98_004791 [Podochytrium sp. JEL0797]|nr:hypothetical protein HDU98_004791 [Podochytrium sp. JEL0797]
MDQPVVHWIPVAASLLAFTGYSLFLWHLTYHPTSPFSPESSALIFNNQGVVFNFVLGFFVTSLRHNWHRIRCTTSFTLQHATAAVTAAMWTCAANGLVVLIACGEDRIPVDELKTLVMKHAVLLVLPATACACWLLKLLSQPRSRQISTAQDLEDQEPLLGKSENTTSKSSTTQLPSDNPPISHSLLLKLSLCGFLPGTLAGLGAGWHVMSAFASSIPNNEPFRQFFGFFYVSVLVVTALLVMSAVSVHTNKTQDKTRMKPSSVVFCILQGVCIGLYVTVWIAYGTVPRVEEARVWWDTMVSIEFGAGFIYVVAECSECLMNQRGGEKVSEVEGGVVAPSVWGEEGETVTVVAVVDVEKLNLAKEAASALVGRRTALVRGFGGIAIINSVWSQLSHTVSAEQGVLKFMVLQLSLIALQVAIIYENALAVVL